MSATPAAVPVLPKFRLNTGAEIPCVAFGTFMIKPEDAKEATLAAIKAGYRSIDTAAIYFNEKEIGEGIAEAIAQGIVKREDLFITTKVFNNCHGDRVHGSVERSLAALGVKYLDLLLMHFPHAFRDFEMAMPLFVDGRPNPALVVTVEYLDTWKEMERVHAEGLAHNIGVCNFTAEQLEDVKAHSKIVPCVNQFEIHPYLTQNDLVTYCQKEGILVQAFCSFLSGIANEAHPAVHTIPKIIEIAKNHGVTCHQVILRWLNQRDIMLLPRSINPEHIAANLQFLHFTLTEEEMKTMGSMNDGYRLGVGFTKGHYF